MALYNNFFMVTLFTVCLDGRISELGGRIIESITSIVMSGTSAENTEQFYGPIICPQEN